MGLVTASSINYELHPLDRVIGYYVYDNAERDVADIRDLLVDDTTHRPRYALVEIGGFMSIRGKRVLLPWGALIKGGMSRLNINCTMEHITAAPLLMDPLNPTRGEEESIHGHFNVEPYWLEEETQIVTDVPEEKKKAKPGPAVKDLRMEKDDE